MTTVLRLRGVGVRRGGRDLLAGVDLVVESGQRWVILGPNGSGKTTLVRVASLADWPTSGTVELFGHPVAGSDVRQLRCRVGVASASVADAIRPALPAIEVVMSARRGALETWWHHYDDADRTAALVALGRVDVGPLADRTFGTLSSGERQRVLVARALVSDSDLLVLDEPTAGLDLGARERFVQALHRLAADPTTPPILFVTHHVEEIPPAFTHALLLADGQVVAHGPMAEMVCDELVSAAFSLPVTITHREGRWSATARPAGPR